MINDVLPRVQLTSAKVGNNVLWLVKDGKEWSECLDEGLEKKASVETLRCGVWKLREDVYWILLGNDIVSIVVPLVLKMWLNSVSQSLWELVIVIESS